MPWKRKRVERKTGEKTNKTNAKHKNDRDNKKDEKKQQKLLGCRGDAKPGRSMFWNLLGNQMVA